MCSTPASSDPGYPESLDWRTFHFLNGLLRGHDGWQDAVAWFAGRSVPVFAVATVALWFAARPGATSRWKLACGSALAAASVGLLANQAIGHVWFRDRPFTAHPHATLVLSARSHDPSFPSDHATAAFAIAFAVLAFSRPIGLAFLGAAAAIGFSRILVGLHYPGDILAGAAIGLVSAAIVVTKGRSAIGRVVSLASRLSDPLLRTLWRLVPRYRPQVVSVLALAASLYAFAQLAEDTAQHESIVGTDHRLAVWIHSHTSDGLIDPVRIFTQLGGVVVLALVTLVAVAMLARRRRFEAAALVIACFAGMELLNASLKAAFHRPRPHFAHPLVTLPHSYSFPSGHASVSVAVYGALALILASAVRSTWARTAIGASALSLAALIGASRVVLDVHYLSDVLAGFSVGVAWLSACVLAVLALRSGLRLRHAGRRGLVRPSARVAP